MAEGVGDLHLGDEAVDVGVRRLGLGARGVGLGGRTAETVVGRRTGDLVGGGGPVVGRHALGLRRVAHGGRGAEGQVVVGGALVGEHLRLAVGGRGALDRDGLDARDEAEDIGSCVVRVRGAGAGVVGRGGQVAEVLGGEDPAGAVGQVVRGARLGLAAAVAALGHRVAARLGRLGERGVAGAPGVGVRRGVVPHRGLDDLGDELVAVVRGGLQLVAGELLVVGVGAALGVGDRHRAGGAVRLLVTVQALEVGVVDPGRLGALAAGGHLDLAVALPAAPGEVLVLGHAVRLGLTPGRGALVVVLGDLLRGSAGPVGLDDLVDDVLVEPVGDRVEEARRGPDDRVAALGGLARLGQGVLRALRRGVVDVQLGSGLAQDGGETEAVEGGDGLAEAVHAVGQLGAQQFDRGDLGAAALAALVVDLRQPQGLRLVAVVRELVRERPRVHVVVGRGVLADLRGDTGQPLTGPEGGRDLRGVALGVRRAVPVHRDVRPVGGVRRLEVGRKALEGLGLQAPLLRGEHDAGRGLRRVHAAVALAVVDALDPAARGVRGAVDVGLAVQGVVVRLLAVEVRHDVALAVLDVVEVPPPALLARRVREGRVVAGLARVVAEDRGRPYGRGLLVARGPARQPVLAEVVLGAVGRGDLPVLTVVVAVGGARELLDLRAVVGREPPLAVRVTLDELGGRAVEHDGGVVEGPALLGGGRLAVLRTGLVAALDVAGLVREALAEPGALVVGVGGTAVRGLRGVAEADRRDEAAGGGRRAQRVRPGEAARGGGHAPLGRGGQRGGGVRALRGGVARREGHHRAARRGSGRHRGHAGHTRRGGQVRRDRLRLRVVDRLERELDQLEAGSVAAAEAVGERRVFDVQPDLAAVGGLVGPLDAQQRARTELRGTLGRQHVDPDLAGLLGPADRGGREGGGRRLRAGLLRGGFLRGGDGDGQAAHLHLGRSRSAGGRDGQFGAAAAGPDGLVELLDGRLGGGVRRAGLGLGLASLDGVAEILDSGPLGAAGGEFQGLDGRGGQGEAQADDD